MLSCGIDTVGSGVAMSPLIEKYLLGEVGLSDEGVSAFEQLGEEAWSWVLLLGEVGGRVGVGRRFQSKSSRMSKVGLQGRGLFQGVSRFY